MLSDFKSKVCFKFGVNFIGIEVIYTCGLMIEFKQINHLKLHQKIVFLTRIFNC